MAATQSPRARLFHIRDEIDGVAVVVKELSFEQYQASYVHRRAVERAAQIISEAAKALPPELLARMAKLYGSRSLESEMCCDTSINGSITG